MRSKGKKTLAITCDQRVGPIKRGSCSKTGASFGQVKTQSKRFSSRGSVADQLQLKRT